MADKGKKSSMETFASNDKANYYSGITSITVNGKNAYELKGKFLDDLHNNAFSGTNRKDAVEHIEYYLKIIDPIKLPNIDHDKPKVVVFPISLAGGSRRWFDRTKESITCWVDLTAKFFGKYYPPSFIEGNNTPKMGGDEIEVSDNESSDLEEYWSDKEETAKIFKIETDVFNYETPLCLGLNEFNYLLKPWLDNGIWKEPKPVKHTCKPFNYKTGCSEWPTCSWREDDYCNGGNFSSAYHIGNSLHYQDLEWYEALEDSELKDEALRNKSIMEGLIRECENKTHDEGHELCIIKTREVPVCQIKRYKMIKYSFNDEEEYVVVKEDEYDDLTIIRPWKQRISANIGGEFTNLEDLSVGVLKPQENGNSWVPIPVTTPSESGTSTATKMTMPSTTEEKTCKKNDVKARNLLLMALSNEHQLTFDQYVDAQSMFAAIKARFRGNEATKKTQKALLKQQYENFSASSSESLDSIFNRLQRLVSRLAILGVVTPPEDLNVKFLRSLPSEWDTHVVVWRNKPDFDTMGLDDLYNNFKIVEQKVKKSAGASNDDKNLAFVTTSGASSTNNINTVNPEVSTATTKVNTASTEICTASFSDATVYAFLSTQPKGSQLVHEDLEQLHDDDLEEMDLKWNMALLSMRARKFYQRTGRKIIIDGSNTAGYDKSKVECFNCHKMGHFARECRAPRSKDNRNWNQGSSTKTVKIEDASEKAMCAIDGAGFDWSDMAEEEIQANMALMAFSDSEVKNDKSCSKNCLKNYEALKKQYDDLLVKLSDTDFKAATYKRGLATLEDQIVKYREHEVRFSEEIALLKRSVGSKEYQLGLLRTELEKVKQEKEGVDFKIAKFDKSAKDLDQLLGSQITDNSKKGLGYSAVPPPHPLIYNRPNKLDLSYSGLDEFKEPEFKGYGPENSKKESNVVCENSSNETKKNSDAPLIEEWVSDNEDEVESPVMVKKKIVFPTAAKIEFVRPKQHEKPVRKPVKYAEMYRSQKPRGNQRNWNNLKSQQLGNEFVMNNKACFACGSFNHLIKDCKRKVQKPIWNNARRVNHHNSHRMSYPHPKRNFVPKAVLMKTRMRLVNVAKPKAAYNAVKRNRFNAVKASAFWVWMPKNRVVDHVSKNISASVTLKRLDYIDAQGRFKSVMDAHAQGRKECSKEKEESREECSKSRKTKKMKWEDCWELNPSELVLPRDELVLLSQQLVLLEENSSYCSRLQLPVLNQSVNTARITAVGEKVNAAESLLVVSTEVNAN
ncbi:ribonuclease H-like domain-containing protein [Tanacetum coccineum]